ncbi:MAG: siroheme decarboxylase subunit beta [Desulfocucumaceae bacterium]
MLSPLEQEIIKVLQDGLPLVSRPFAVMAERLEITEEKLLETIMDMVDRGLIRRFGAAVRHQDLGYTANAMVVWNVPDQEVERAGLIFSGFSEVSHCYQRKTSGSWKYNLFTMVHGRNEEECRDSARVLALASGVTEYLVLFSTDELKKESMRYFV